MRRLLLLVLLALAPLAAPAAELELPALTGRVVDEAGLLDAATRRRLGDALAAHEQATGQQVAVVTVPSLQGRPIEEFGYKLGRAWGLGDAGRDDGLLLLVAPVERKVRIEVGYGLEGTMTDARARLIIENDILPAFRSGDMQAGIVAGTAVILAVLAGDENAAALSLSDTGEPPWAAFVSGFVVFMLIMSLLASLAIPKRTDIGVWGRDNPYDHLRRHGHGWWIVGGGSGGGGGGFGGGGFRGGGGGFGGGGASGGW